MRFRTTIALTVCIAFLGTSIVPASILPCCCSLKKVKSECCSIPTSDDQEQAPSCCGSKNSSNSGVRLTSDNATDSCGLTADQSKLRCQCSSQTKAPALTDSRSLTPNIYETLASVYNLCENFFCLLDVDSANVYYSSSFDPIHRLLQSGSLRI